MAGVGGLMKLVRQMLNGWKIGKSSELKLTCENGVMKVTMAADLGAWALPKPSEACNRNHMGPRRRAHLTPLNPLSVRLFVRSSVRQNHLWAQRALQASAGPRKKPL